MNKKFQVGQTVYLKTDPEQQERMVVGIMERPTAFVYYLALGTIESPHYDIEITASPDVLKSLTSYKEQWPKSKTQHY